MTTAERLCKFVTLLLLARRIHSRPTQTSNADVFCACWDASHPEVELWLGDDERMAAEMAAGRIMGRQSFLTELGGAENEIRRVLCLRGQIQLADGTPLSFSSFVGADLSAWYSGEHAKACRRDLQRRGKIELRKLYRKFKQERPGARIYINTRKLNLEWPFTARDPFLSA